MAQLLHRRPLADMRRPPLAVPQTKSIGARIVIALGQLRIHFRGLLARHQVRPQMHSLTTECAPLAQQREIDSWRWHDVVDQPFAQPSLHIAVVPQRMKSRLLVVLVRFAVDRDADFATRLLVHKLAYFTKELCHIPGAVDLPTADAFSAAACAP